MRVAQGLLLHKTKACGQGRPHKTRLLLIMPEISSSPKKLDDEGSPFPCENERL